MIHIAEFCVEAVEDGLGVAIRAAHSKLRETYGVRRLQPELGQACWMWLNSRQQPGVLKWGWA